MHWYTDVIKKYAVFDGRAGRPEFWWFTLFNAIIYAILYVILLSVSSGSSGLIIADLYALAVFLPSLGVGIRRLHDTNRSGWWILISFVPVVGWIVLLVLYALAGDPGPNRYGSGPDQTAAVGAAI